MPLSPTATSRGTRLPLSSMRPGPIARTSPSWGFSLAVSGMTSPEAVVSSASSGLTTIRSSRGLMLTDTSDQPPLSTVSGLGSSAPGDLEPALTYAVADGSIEVVDLTAPLSSGTPVIQLPPEFGQTARFELEEISRYDDRGPAWYWNNFRSGEHTGTHLDAPNHWVTGREGLDVAGVPVAQLIRPVVVLDFSARCSEDPDFLLEVEDVKKWEQEFGPLPEGGWMIYR